MLRLQLLGVPTIQVAQASVVSLDSRKAAAMFYYLAVLRTPVARGTLIALLWPEMAEQKAKNNFRTTLAKLKSLFSPYLTVTRLFVALNVAQPYDLDVDQLGAPLEDAIVAQDFDQLYAVIQLYRGEFLEDFLVKGATPFNEWVFQQREHYRSRIFHAFEQLFALCANQDRNETALALGYRLLALEPSSESAHRYVMHYLAAMGKFTEALAQYTACQQMLHAELGAEPSPETVALYETILHHIQAAGTEQPKLASSSGIAKDASPMQDDTARSPFARLQMVPHNLPTPLAAFVGRQKELNRLEQHLADKNSRLLTIMGLGGMGKTSLALAVGQRLLQSEQPIFPDGIFFVPLLDIGFDAQPSHNAVEIEPPMAAEKIIRAIVKQLNTRLEERLSSIQQLHAYLHSRRILLILDNFEHLLPGGHVLGTLLTQAPGLTILTTSRAQLNLRGEHLFLLDHLSLPSSVQSNVRIQAPVPNGTGDLLPDDPWHTSDAIKMFVQRAHLSNPAFTLNSQTIGAVARICELVEGLPLGIELATKMLSLLSCDELVDELTSGLDFLVATTRDLPARQHSLSAIFEKTWALLSSDSRKLLAQLTLFPGSFRYEAVKEITGAGDLAWRDLLDLALVSETGQRRYNLHRIIYEFAHQKLDELSLDLAPLRKRYVYFYLDFLASQEQALTGAAYRRAIEEIQSDLHNIHAALRRAVIHGFYRSLNDSMIALIIFNDQQGFFLDTFSLASDMLSHLQHVERLAKNEPVDADRQFCLGSLQLLLGLAHIRLGRTPEALAAFEVSWPYLQRHGYAAVVSLNLVIWGASLRSLQPERALTLLSDSVTLVKTSKIYWLHALCVQSLGEANFLYGNYEAANAQIAEGLQIAQICQWPRGIASAEKSLVMVTILTGDYRQAEQMAQQAAHTAQQHHLYLLYFESVLLRGVALRLQNRLAEAQAALVEGESIATETGIGTLHAALLWEEGCLAEQLGNHLKAKHCFAQSIERGLPNWWITVMPTPGWVMIALGETAEAKQYFHEVMATTDRNGRLPLHLEAKAGLAYLTWLEADERSQSAKERRLRRQQICDCFVEISKHRATAQQTRDRLAALAATFSGTAV